MIWNINGKKLKINIILNNIQVSMNPGISFTWKVHTLIEPMIDKQ